MRKGAKQPEEEEEMPFAEGAEEEEEEASGDNDVPSSDEEAGEEGEEDEGEDNDEEGEDEDDNYGLGDDDEDGSEEEEGDRQQAQRKGFLAGEKGESFARAFAKILGRAAGTAAAAEDDDEEDEEEERPAKKAKLSKKKGGDEDDCSDEGESEEGESDSDEDRSQDGAGPSDRYLLTAPALKAIHSGPILAGSKTLAKRQQEAEDLKKAAAEGKKLKAALKKRGHRLVAKKGADPAADAAEKVLARIATKGVVTLFNAVSKAQKAVREAEAQGQGNAKLSKASFFSDLKGEQKRASMGAVNAARTAAAGTAGSGWDVLGGSIQGLAGGAKMKDWDKELEEEEGLEDVRGVDEQADYDMSDSEDERSDDDSGPESDDDLDGSEDDEDDEGAW